MKKLINMRIIQISIDGDAGSGKTTVGNLLSKKLNFEFIDSGLFYRLVTYLIIKEGFKKKGANWLDVLKDKKISFSNGVFFINGVPLENNLLKSKEVDEFVSQVSKPLEVRTHVNDLLRSISKGKSVVMVGRDIGTVVLKDAFLKVFLTATLEERAIRRYRELKLRKVKVSLTEVIENLRTRDFIDSSRENSPLSIPKDAFIIDTTSLTAKEVVARIMSFLEGKKYAICNASRIR